MNQLYVLDNISMKDCSCLSVRYHIWYHIEVTYDCMFTDVVFTGRVAGNVLFGLYHQLVADRFNILTLHTPGLHPSIHPSPMSPCFCSLDQSDYKMSLKVLKILF